MTYNPKERFELYKQSVAQGLRWADVSSGKVQVQKFQEEGEVKDDKTEFASQSVGDTTETLISNLSEKLDWTEGRKKYETQKSSKRIQNFLQTDFGKNAVASLSKEDMAALLQKVEGLAGPIIDVADKGSVSQIGQLLKTDLSFLKPYREKMGYESEGGIGGNWKAKKRFIKDILSYEKELNLDPAVKSFSGAFALLDFKDGGPVKQSDKVQNIFSINE